MKRLWEENEGGRLLVPVEKEQRRLDGRCRAYQHRKHGLLMNSRSEATLDPHLTNYAQGLGQDVDMSLSEYVAPTVPVGATIGRYTEFNEKEHFLEYRKQSKRALGGKRHRIEHGKVTKHYDATPHGLEIPIDDSERDAAGNAPNAARFLEEGKTRTLVISSYLSDNTDVVQTMLENTAVTAGLGNWTNDAIDPIDEMNQMIDQLANQMGMWPNKILYGVPVATILAGNQKIKDRQKSGVVSADFSVLKPGLIHPGIEHKCTPLVTDATKHGTSTKKRANIVGAEFIIFYSASMTTLYDPSFMKTMRGGQRSITGVYNYRDDSCASDIYYVDWSVDVKVTAPGCYIRIQIS